MKKLFTKKVLAVITVVSLLSSIGSIAYSASTLKKITAYQNAGIAVEVNGKQVDISSPEGPMHPIVYDGHSYVSAKSVAEALGATVKWDNDRQAVVITASGETDPNLGIPDKDNTTAPTTPTPTTPPTSTTSPSTSPSSSSSSSSSSNKGTLSDPISLGTTYTYTDNVNYKPGVNDTTSAQYSLTVKKVTPISVSSIVALGFKAPDSEDSAKIEYVMLDLNLKVNNATIKKGSDASNNGYQYLATYRPSFWGSKSTDGKTYLIGGTEYGFDGSLSDKISALLTDGPKVTPGKPGSYEVTGKLLLPIIKGMSNVFVIKKTDLNIEYDDAFVYFKLK